MQASKLIMIMLLGLMLNPLSKLLAEVHKVPMESIVAAADATKSVWQTEVQDLDEEIRKLTNQRNLYLSKATRLQNQGDRLQFEAHDLIDARRAWQQAEINREIATRLQKEIDILEKQRKDLLNKYGIKNYPPSSAYQRSA